MQSRKHEALKLEKHAPKLYKLGTSKISNKNLRKALNSYVANYIVKETQKKQRIHK